MARRAGWVVNNKRIRPLRRDEGLGILQMDFQFDTTANGRILTMSNRRAVVARQPE